MTNYNVVKFDFQSSASDLPPHGITIIHTIIVSGAEANERLQINFSNVLSPEISLQGDGSIVASFPKDDYLPTLRLLQSGSSYLSYQKFPNGEIKFTLHNGSV